MGVGVKEGKSLVHLAAFGLLSFEMDGDGWIGWMDGSLWYSLVDVSCLLRVANKVFLQIYIYMYALRVAMYRLPGVK